MWDQTGKEGKLGWKLEIFTFLLKLKPAPLVLSYFEPFASECHLIASWFCACRRTTTAILAARISRRIAIPAQPVLIRHQKKRRSSVGISLSLSVDLLFGSSLSQRCGGSEIRGRSACEIADRCVRGRNLSLKEAIDKVIVFFFRYSIRFFSTTCRSASS